MAKTFQIYNNHTQFAQFIVLIIFTPLGIAITALRFVATRHGARKFGLEDWMAIAATVFFVLVNLAGLVGELRDLSPWLWISKVCELLLTITSSPYSH